MQQADNLKQEYLAGKQTILRKDKKRRYIKTSNEYLKRDELSYRSKGLNAYILSKQDNWKVMVSYVANKHKKGKCYVSSAKKELVDAGYWHYIRIRKDSGEYEKGVTLVFDESRESVSKKYFSGDKKIFRTKSDGDYTLLTCDHLDDPRLSLEAKGIFSYILTKPDNWNINIDHLNKKGTESIGIIRREINQLIKYGYIQRFRVFKDGKLSDWQMVASEDPFNESERIKSVLYFDNSIKINYENGRSEIEIISKENDNNIKKDDENIDKEIIEKESKKPSEDKQSCAFNILHENLLVVNIDEVNHHLPITNNLNNTNKNNLSLYKNNKKEKIDNYICFSKDDIKKQIDYDVLIYDGYSKNTLDTLVNVIQDVLNYDKKVIRISSSIISAVEVKEVFKALNHLHIQYFLECLDKVDHKIRNKNEYFKKSLYYAPSTMELHYEKKYRSSHPVEYSDYEEEEISKYEDAAFKKTHLDNDFKTNETCYLEENKADLNNNKSKASIWWSRYLSTVNDGIKSYCACFIDGVVLENKGLCLIVKGDFGKKLIKEKYLPGIKKYFKDNHDMDVFIKKV